jgi:hypothetical protein
MFAFSRGTLLGQPDDPLLKNVNPTGSLTGGSVRQWIEGRGKPLNVRRLDSCAVSQND